jgi:hypothetical protein
LRQGQLDDRALRLLVDADWSALDVSGCTWLTGDGLLAALRLTPAVRQLDITNCSAGAAVLRALPSLCPRITVLRIGECHTNNPTQNRLPADGQMCTSNKQVPHGG